MIMVSKKTLRPGSGNLGVEMITDGPTRFITITNINEKSHHSINWEFENKEDKSIQSKKISKSVEIYINLTGGIGISLVHWFKQEYEELVYGYLKSIEINFEQNNLEQKIMLNVQSIQLCNQLLNASKHNLLYIHNSQNFTSESPSSSNVSTQQQVKKLKPALHVDILRVFKHDNIITIKHLIVKLFDVNLQVEEKLLWKIIQMCRFDKTESTVNEIHSQKPRMRIKKRTISQSSGVFFNKSQFENEHFDSDSISLNYYKTRINSLISNSKAVKYRLDLF